MKNLRVIFTFFTCVVASFNVFALDIGSGSNSFVETDYVYQGGQDFTFKRYYNHGFRGWRFDFEDRVSYSNYKGIEVITITRSNFQNIVFKKIDNVWVDINNNKGLGNSGIDLTFDLSNSIILNFPNGDRETYSSAQAAIGGLSNAAVYRLVRREKINGHAWDIIYTNTKQKKIIDSFGREFIINYGDLGTSCNGNLNVVSFIGVNGKAVNYGYDKYCALYEVSYPDSTGLKYTYDTTGLLSVADNNNNIVKRFTYIYSSTVGGHKIGSQGRGPTGSIDKITLSYSSNKVQVKDALNNSSTLTLIKDAYNNSKITGYSSPCPACRGVQGSSISYDSNGFIDTVVDFKGYATHYTWNSKGKLVQKKEAAGTAQEKTTTVQYDYGGILPQNIAITVEGGTKQVQYDYTADNQINNVSITAPNGRGTLTNKTYSLQYGDKQLPVEIRGLNYSFNPQDKTSIEYNPQGQIIKITNGLGHISTFNNYDDYGNPTLIGVPSGQIINLEYDLRGKRLLSKKVSSSLIATDGEITEYVYDNAGQLIKIVYPAENYLLITYDTALRVSELHEYSAPDSTNPLGMYIGKAAFTLDNMSNITATKIFDKNNNIVIASQAQYDNKNRLFKTIGSLNQTATNTYDGNSNLTETIDEGGFKHTKAYDALNRLQLLTAPDGAATSITYTAADDIASVVDPKGLSTTYNYDGFGNLIKIISPDSGITTYHYDLNDNLVSKVDANANTTTYDYDVLNRLVSRTASSLGNSTQSASFVYDTCMIGALCSMVDNSGTTTYIYNSKGRLQNKTFAPIGTALLFTTQYTYDDYGQISSTTYPSINAPGFSYTGSSFNYNHENGKIKSISKNGALSLVDNIHYLPFSSEPISYHMGGYNYSKTLSQDGVPTSISYSQTNAYSKDYTYDSRSNITAINSQSIPLNKSLSMTYDNKSRVIGTGYVGLSEPSVAYGYAYNTSDDRLVATKPSGTYSYSYPSNSHKLSSISAADTFTYDSNGNIVSSSVGGANQITMQYDTNNRMKSSISPSHEATYTYNALGQRVKKVVLEGASITTTWFIYDESGLLIADYINKNGIWTTNEYVYLYGKPVALIRNSEVFHIQADHINTPRTITKASDGALVWSWENKEVFGNNEPVEHTAGFQFNLRFMGQYHDAEKGTSYNYYRDYAPGLGRYMQSDPIGLAGGINTYGYAEGNPLKYTDRFGLDIWVEGSSGKEPYLHKGLSIGDPYGIYKTYSFAITPNCWGCVYREDDLGGKILELLSTTPEQDYIIEKEIIEMMKYDNNRVYGLDITCRGYTEEKFAFFKQKYSLRNKTFLQRQEVERNWKVWPQVITSSTITKR